MPKLGLLAFLAPVVWCSLAAPARATDRFVCDCGAGADPQCVAGNDAAAGTSPAAPWRTYDRAQDAWPALLAGETLSFCRGGVFPISGGTDWVNTHCTRDVRCTLGAYAPPWGSGDEQPPRLVQSSGNGLSFANGGDAEHEEGYVVRDLELACTACGSDDFGIFFYNDIDDVLLQRLFVHGFAIGVHLSGSNRCGADPRCDGRNSRIVLSSSMLTDNSDQGWLGSGDGVVIADNFIARNGRGTVFSHNLYLDEQNGATTGIQVLRNELYRAAAADSGSCEGTSLVVHGEHSDLLIEGNFIHEDVGAADVGCWGLSVTPAYPTAENFVRVVIRGNRIRNVGNQAIAVASCSDCVVENNIVEYEQPFEVTAIGAPGADRDANDRQLTRLTVRNNSVWIGGAGGGVAVRVGGEGSGHVVVSNALQATTASSSFACLSLDLPPASYAAVDSNVCGFAAGGGREWEEGSGSLTAWRAASGLDAASLFAAPGFASPGAASYDMTAASAGAAMVGRGHPSRSAPREYFGSLRATPPDAGAHQRGQGPPLFVDGFESGDTRRWAFRAP